MDEYQGGYFAIIPADVMNNGTLSDSAKLLYGRISVMVNKRGYCWATNANLAEQSGQSLRTVQRLVNQLVEAGYLRAEVLRDKETNEVLERRLYLHIDPLGAREEAEPEPEAEEEARQICRDPSRQICREVTSNLSGGHDKNGVVLNENNKSLKKQDIPPKAPHGGRRGKSVPEWEPEMFEAFWKLYPRGEDRQGAVAEWDKLRPDLELMQTMGAALRRQKDTEEWQRGIGIPYAVRWLRRERWKDVPLERPGTGARDDVPRVIERKGVREL